MDRRRLLLAAGLALLPLPALASGAKKAAKKGEGEAAGPAKTYQALDTLNATARRPNGARGIMTLEVGLDIPDEKLRERAALIMPRVRASLLDAFQTYAAGLAPGAMPNTDILAQRLQQAANAALGGGGATLLIGSVIMN